MAEVVLQAVCKIYDGNVTAVENFNLEIEHGELLVLVGPSGCGKSTTLRMIAGLEEITKGTIKIGDRIVNDVPPKDRDIAMVFQNYALYPHMTVYENMAFGLKLRKFKKDEIDQRVKEAARILELEPYLQRRPKALSGGQRQRVAMGRAIVRNPKVFLFDEPLSNLDAKMRVDMRREILHLHKRVATTMIYVTHDQVEAMTLGDRICIMRDGIIEQVGSPDQIFDKPASLFVANFIGSPPMNILDGSLEERDGEVIFDGDTLQLLLPETMVPKVRGHIGKQVCLGIRPRAFTVDLDGTSDSTTGVTGEVDITEMLGEEVLIHLTNGKHRFIASVEPCLRTKLGKEVKLVVELSRAHIFDAETEKNLTL